MVTRKPVAPPLSTSTSPQPNSNTNPPYPTTPITTSAKTTSSVYSPDLHRSPAFELIDRAEAQQRPRSDSDASSHGTWDSEGSDDEEADDMSAKAEVPKPLNVRNSQVPQSDQMSIPSDVPAILRPGPASRNGEEASSKLWTDGSKPSSPGMNGNLTSNNPYLSRQNASAAESSQSAWKEFGPPLMPATGPPLPPASAPPAPPVELPTIRSPTEELQQMSFQEQRKASWQTAEVLEVPQQGQSPFPHPTSRPSSEWWQDGTQGHSNGVNAAILASTPGQRSPGQPQHPQQVQEPLIDLEPTSSKPPQTTSTSIPGPAQAVRSPNSATSQADLKHQRNEHYQIKHVNWVDVSNGSKLRRSPVLVQNVNGPCPLLALVNALTLSTPAGLDTALIETLTTREQVSLGLLLDAVFDELMSGRRGDSAHELPDVTELYSFLLALHTGMNVNPRFVTPARTPRGSLDGHPPELSTLHPMLRAQSKPGVFEETKEMRLYSTFNIPLIHGWTAPADTPAYEAFVRSAPTFEDAQNIQFAESDLEEKLQREELTPQEQQTLLDIQTIKSWLASWPTQLTEHGLSTISHTLQSAQFAILFRNDHFSTIYKEPNHGALMTLVTDAGYSTHDEIVWESLVDVSGAASEMFSGDFRAVSHGQDVTRLNSSNTGGGEDGWQTVEGRNRGRNSRTSATSAEQPPMLPGPRPPRTTSSSHTNVPDHSVGQAVTPSDAQRTAAEQEDHDLALALQLQEEEEDHQRQAEQRRRREQELSERYLSAESNNADGPRPPIPPRRNNTNSPSVTNIPVRSGNTTTSTTSARSGRAPVSRPADDGDPDAPPSYEQAASDRPYRPAGSTAPATLSQGNPLGAYDALRRQQSAYIQQSTSNHSNSSNGVGGVGATPSSPRRRSDGNRINRRRSSQVGSPVGPPAGGYPGAYPASAAAYPPVQQGQRIPGAPGLRDAEERCTVM